jgi:3-dehydroquinate dehydratase-2
MRIAVINGPNLRLLGTREPEIYGRTSLDDINARVEALAVELGAEVEFFQSNHEGEILDHLEEIKDRADGIVINPGGLTHTSVCLRDGLTGIGLPFVEVHLSNTGSRERFRRNSYLSAVALGVVLGLGADSYLLGLRGLVAHLTES